MDSISNLKEQEILETPLLLFDCELTTGDLESWSTHSVLYEGRDYTSRVLRHNVFEMQSASDAGIDAVSKVSVALANADSHFSQIERNIGWKGAKLTIRFLFFNLKDATPASESVVLFRGIANPPEEVTEASMRLTFTNRLGLQRILLPEIRIQRRCPWTFPANAEQREEAIHGGDKGKYSPFFRCGYSAGHSGGTGNLNGGVPFTTCDYTRAQCEIRGMFKQDSTSNPTRRFGGIEFLPASILVRSYGEQGRHISTPVENQARYNDFVPLIYGTGWYEPPVVFARNDGNLTRMEVLLGMGEIEDVLKVVVNDNDIPEGHAGEDMTSTGWYNIINTGNRTGNFNLDYTDNAGNPIGDPYGSMAYLSVVAPNRISKGSSLPRIQVLLEGLEVEQFDSNGTYIETAFSNNPAWVLLDILRRCGWAPDEIDIPSFAETAAYCEEEITAYDLHGNPTLIPRFQCNLVIRKRRSAADIVRGIRNGSGLYITYGAGGLLQLRAEESFATQQLSKPDGSNSVEEFNGGWPAYEFGDASSSFSGILRRASGEPSIRFWSRPISDTPNRFSVEFQDAFNEYQQDSLSLVDMDDALSAGQEVNARLSALGIPNFSQAARIMTRQLNKGIRGNLFAEFETSVRAIGLRPGDLITLTYLKEGFQRQPFRIIKISASTNHRTFSVICQQHDDTWYTDDADSSAGPGRQPTGESGLPRPLIGLVLDENEEPQFEVTEVAKDSSDGTVMLNLTIGFATPRKPDAASVGIPLLSLAPTIETVGGNLEGNQILYYAVSTVDANGAESDLSFIVRATIPSDTNTNVVVLKDLSFSANTSGIHVYRGKTPVQLYQIASNVSPTNEFQDTGLTPSLVGPPDANYDHAKFYWRLELVPEHSVTVYSDNTIGSDILEMIDNEHTGMVARITSGKGAGQERSVLSNTADTLTVTPDWDTVPDTSSAFVVAESSWHLGAAGITSPIEFEVPNREGTTVHISGRSANVHGQECAYELSPLTRWVIGGSSGLALDSDVPGQPIFGLYPTSQGTVELVGVSFTELTNTRSIQAATLTLHYWNEFSSPSNSSLGVALDDEDTIVELSTAGPGYIGCLIQIGTEILVIEEVLNDGLQYEVTRGTFDTTPQNHDAQTLVYHLDRKAYVVPFVRDFFGSPASGSYGYPIFLPDVRIAAAELFATNNRGNSETARNGYTTTLDYGLRTLSGGQFSIQIEGYLAIQSNAAPPLIIEDPHSIREIFAVVREAPTGAPVELELRKDNEFYCDLTISSGATMSNIVNGFGLPPLLEGNEISLNVLSVGQTAETSPGSDLTVTIRL